jgi:integron integrase
MSPRYPQIERLLTQADRLLRVRSYSPRTRATYLAWIKRFLMRNKDRHPDSIGRPDVERFLLDLTHAQLAPKSRNQASSALALFFREVLGRDVLRTMARAREPKRVPTVLSQRQVELVIEALSGKYQLLAALMYGAGLRLTEAHRLRIKDIDFDLMQITVRDGKGAKDRWVMLPERLVPRLRRQIDKVTREHEEDLRAGAGWAAVPSALARKDRTVGYDLGWQYLFPARRRTQDPLTGRRGRHHLNPTATQREVRKAGRTAQIPKPVTCHTLRRTFATQMLRAGYDVRTVQRLMGHRDVRTTMVYIEAITDTGIAMRSPLDQTALRD